MATLLFFVSTRTRRMPTSLTTVVCLRPSGGELSCSSYVISCIYEISAQPFRGEASFSHLQHNGPRTATAVIEEDILKFAANFYHSGTLERTLARRFMVVFLRLKEFLPGTLQQGNKHYRKEGPSAWTLISLKNILRLDGKIYNGRGVLPQGTRIAAFDNSPM